MRDVNADRSYYINCWRILLSQLLDWTDRRINTWIKRAELLFDMANPDAWVYHEAPLYTVIPLMIRSQAGGALSDEDFHLIQAAIRRAFDYGRPDFTQVTDWSFYKEQMDCVLSDYSRKIKPARERRKELAAKA